MHNLSCILHHNSYLFQIPLTIGDISYRFSVNTNKENVLELAEKVCSENAGALGIAATDLEARCIAPVAKSLSEQVDLTLEQIVPVSARVNIRCMVKHYCFL